MSYTTYFKIRIGYWWSIGVTNCIITGYACSLHLDVKSRILIVTLQANAPGHRAP